ncbi:hypothetical protein [Botrimarina colliarenosi]|uniref:hypothetical protein n=1 Tax=Botrimarina colliarenosi TaxID=2528001 RepID=UPI0011B5F83A|nr:hypothetical protein [Botrimarina colliarenosi]
MSNEQWDVVIAQPFRSGSSNLASDVTAVQAFSAALDTNPLNSSTRWALYQSWPFKKATYTVDDEWDAWFDPTDGLTRHRQAYYKALQGELAQVGVAADIIPNADVLHYVIDNPDKFDAFSQLGDLYRDDIHMSKLGSFIVGSTLLTYLNNADLTGINVRDYGAGLDQHEKDQFLSAIWRIVATSQRLGDLNGDGFVSSADHLAWSAAYGTKEAGVDANLDGVVNAADYTIWRDAAARTASLSVPEPTGFLIGLAPVGGLFFRRVARRVHAA